MRGEEGQEVMRGREEAEGEQRVTRRSKGN
jgi:hypothetical protein